MHLMHRAAPNVDALGKIFASKLSLSADDFDAGLSTLPVNLMMLRLKVHGEFRYLGSVLP